MFLIVFCVVDGQQDHQSIAAAVEWTTVSTTPAASTEQFDGQYGKYESEILGYSRYTPANSS